MAVNAAAAYGIYSQHVALSDIVLNLNQACLAPAVRPTMQPQN
jgi:hypothetical protein